MGLTADGAMDTTKGPADVGWYKLGQRPGEIGSAVITGHFGWVHNLPAAFDNLHALHPGDLIYIVDDKGASTTFVVSELKQYDQNDSTASVFSSSDGKAHLNLITCEGKWSNTSKSYSNRLVVFTNKV
jgi:LPXTG-site transpeptidase (sortase) family protein